MKSSYLKSKGPAQHTLLLKSNRVYGISVRLLRPVQALSKSEKNAQNSGQDTLAPQAEQSFQGLFKSANGQYAM